MNFLDDFYYGNIKPADKEFVKNSEFDKTLKIFLSSKNELSSMLDKNKTFTELINSHNELLAVTGLEYFKIGFRLGVKMIFATLIDENGVFKDIAD